MAFFRQWLLGVVSCALLVGAVGQLCPDGSVRRLARFAGALLMLLSMLSPLTETGTATLAPWTESYCEAVARAKAELARDGENLLAEGIASELNAYIEDKAGSVGVRVRAAVEMGPHGGVPERVTLYGGYSEALAELIAEQLGVAKEKQIWIEETHPKP